MRNKISDNLVRFLTQNIQNKLIKVDFSKGHLTMQITILNIVRATDFSINSREQ